MSLDLAAATVAAPRRSCGLVQVSLRTEVEFLFALGTAEVIGLPFVLSSPSGSRTFYVHAALSQAQTPGTTEKAVAALEQQWLQSQKTNNPDLVAPLLADKFVNTGSDGKVMSKAEMLADSKATKYDSIDYEDVKVTVFGDTAIATGGSKAKGTDASGKPIDEHVRWTDHG